MFPLCCMIIWELFWLQDLWIVNSAVVLLYPVLANLALSFILFSQGPPTSQSWTSRIPSSLSPSTHSQNHLSLYLDCPILGIQESPHQFDQALVSGLLSFSLPTSKLIQYVNDLLPLHSVPKISQTDTSALLNFLSSQDPRVSASKVQLFILRLPS